MNPVWLVNIVTGDVRVFADNVSAIAAMPTGSDHVKSLSNQASMKGWSEENYRTVYNALTKSDVKKFASEQEARDKTWAAIVAIRPEGETQSRVEPKTKEVTSTSKGKTMTATQTASATSTKKTSKTASAAKKAPKKTAGKKTAASKKGAKKNVTRMKGDYRITLLYKDGNPRRTNTEGFTSWSKLKDGMLLSEAKKKGARQVDIRWDEKKGNLKLTPVK